jgi:hypothetical protein
VTSKQIRFDQPTNVADLLQTCSRREEKVVATPTGKDFLARHDLGHCLADVKDYRSRVMKLIYLATNQISFLQSRPWSLDVPIHERLISITSTKSMSTSTVTSRTWSSTVSQCKSQLRSMHRTIFIRTAETTPVLSSLLEGSLCSTGPPNKRQYQHFRCRRRWLLSSNRFHISHGAVISSELGYTQYSPNPIQQDKKSAFMIYDR